MSEQSGSRAGQEQGPRSAVRDEMKSPSASMNTTSRRRQPATVTAVSGHDSESFFVVVVCSFFLFSFRSILNYRRWIECLFEKFACLARGSLAHGLLRSLAVTKRSGQRPGTGDRAFGAGRIAPLFGGSFHWRD